MCQTSAGAQARGKAEMSNAVHGTAVHKISEEKQS